ncbi:MAG TPA: DinB family protein [Bacteroidota bacterium]|nr:DinB family protein [Bacteroidota bacterium]
MIKIDKPNEGEYAPYAIMYISLLPDDGDVISHLRNNLAAVKSFIVSLPGEKLTYRYAPDKWTIKEVLVHVMDTERIFAYRALRFARNDKTALPGYEQNDYVPYSRANDRSIDNIFREYSAVRVATLSLLESLSGDDFLRSGIANGNPASVRALAYQIAGHELHHMKIIKERYL